MSQQQHPARWKSTGLVDSLYRTALVGYLQPIKCNYSTPVPLHYLYRPHPRPRPGSTFKFTSHGKASSVKMKLMCYRRLLKHQTAAELKFLAAGAFAASDAGSD